ncbi:myoneurin [Perca fluviatilis]|uniref:myoneurin n=1 Tax=Perca fluviatilis TaxID=8168 RepID=UPI001962F324|nr:myoneurin [Perca fluviatilis]
MAHVTNHGKLLLQRLHQQREMDFLCDITIMVRDVEFRAHRNILAAFSKYFSAQAEKGQDVTTLDPDKVSRYALEKLLEFIYTGQMNLSSTRQAAVRRAAVFLGMSEATKFLEETSHWSELSETSQSEADKEAGLSPSSPASPGSASSPVPLSIVSVTGEYQEDGHAGDKTGVEPGDGDAEEGEKSDGEYTPATPKGIGRGQGRKRGRPPKSLSGEQMAEPSSSVDGTPKTQGYRGRGRGMKEEEEDEESGGAGTDDGGEGEREEGEVGEQDPSEMDEMTLSCTECNKLFKDVSSLRRHEKIHKGLKPFVCIFCSKNFRQATQLKTHLRIHTGEKPFNCSSCDKCFAQKCQLVAHRRMHHGEEKPYTCERCGFKFATSSNYKIHIRLHSGEKPYVCDICGQAFAQSSTLTYHKRRHTGEKPYQCDLCGMSFSVSSSLIAHARKHTGETPYKCSQPQCAASFVTSSELKKHMRRLHPEGNNGVQCLLCGNRFASVKNMIKHQEKAHADEVRQHKERARAVVLLASSHPVAFVQSKLSQENKGMASIPEDEPSNPEPTTPTPKASAPSAATAAAANTAADDDVQDFKAEPANPANEQVTYEPDQEQTINSDTLHALVEQLRPQPSPAPSLEQIVIIRTVDNPPQ